MPFKTFCNCCCVDRCLIDDDFSSTLAGYDTHTVSDPCVFSISAGQLTLPYGQSGSYFQTIDLGNLVGRRIVITALTGIVQPADPYTSVSQNAGIFIGNGMLLKSCFTVLTGVTDDLSRSVVLVTGVDQYGNGGTPETLFTISNDLYSQLTIELNQADGTTYNVAVKAGAKFLKLFKLDLTLDTNSKIGLWSDTGGSWDDFCIVKNHNAKAGCQPCLGCKDAAHYPVKYLLSVPALEPQDCSNVDVLAGDFELLYYFQAQLNAAGLIGCGYLSSETDVGSPLCPPNAFTGNLWQLSGRVAGYVQLEATNGVNVLRYRKNIEDWDCTAANTLTYVPIAGYQPAVDIPATLTVIPVFRS